MKFISFQQLGAFYAISSGLCYGLVGYFGMSLIQANLSISTMLFWRFFGIIFILLGVLLTLFKGQDQNKGSSFSSADR